MACPGEPRKDVNISIQLMSSFTHVFLSGKRVSNKQGMGREMKTERWEEIRLFIKVIEDKGALHSGLETHQLPESVSLIVGIKPWKQQVNINTTNRKIKLYY